MSSSDPSTHTNASVEAYATFTPLLGTERSNAVLSGNYAKFTQNPAMKHHLLSTGNKRLAEASPPDPVWGVGLRADDPRAKGPRQWRGKYLLGEALSAIREEFATVRPSWHIRPPLAGSVLPRGMLEPTKNFVRAQLCSLTASSACQVLLRSFRPISLTCRSTKARKVWR